MKMDDTSKSGFLVLNYHPRWEAAIEVVEGGGNDFSQSEEPLRVIS